MEDVDTIGHIRNQYAASAYNLMLMKLRARQTELGITNLSMAVWLGMKEPNYVRLIEGKCPMTALRLFQIVTYLDLDLLLFKSDLNFSEDVSS